MSFASVDELRETAGATLGYTDWMDIDQSRIDRFAEATGDHQWIHVDPQRASEGPFGTTIAHGYLTLSLLPALIGNRLAVDGTKMAVNYGVNKVRFPDAAPVGSRVRGFIELVSVEDTDGGVKVVAQVTVEREGADKPVCVAETVSIIYL